MLFPDSEIPQAIGFLNFSQRTTESLTNREVRNSQQMTGKIGTEDLMTIHEGEEARRPWNQQSTKRG
jgi:hypothetical protein